MLAVIIVHSFCNCMGFPRFWGRVGVEEGVMGPDAGTAKSGSGSIAGKTSIGWTVVYYILLVIGAISWWKMLWPLTESQSALTTFSS